MLFSPRLRPLVGLMVLSCLMEAQSPEPPKREVLRFEAEWRLIRAGTVEVAWTDLRQAELKIFTTGVVGRLYRVEDSYKANYDPGLCVVNSVMDAQEGKRHRDTRITFDRAAKRGSYLERDVTLDKVVAQKELDIPACVHDVLGALRLLRSQNLKPGQNWQLPVSDGKKVVSARVECQAKEDVDTPAGKFKATRYEAFLFNGVLYGRKGRLFIWISDDEKRLPVQIRVQLPFYIGTVTVQLEKVDP
jgi:hypothetical protein